MSEVELSDSYLLNHLIFTATKGWGRETKLQKLRNLFSCSQISGNRGVLPTLGKHTLNAILLLPSIFNTIYSLSSCCVVTDVEHIARMCKTSVFPLLFKVLEKSLLTSNLQKSKGRLLQKKTIHFSF